MGLFTRSQVAEMRDRTLSRRYSPAAEEFRREHERHRAWGLAQRHALTLRHLHGGCAGAAPSPGSPPPAQPATTEAQVPHASGEQTTPATTVDRQAPRPAIAPNATSAHPAQPADTEQQPSHPAGAQASKRADQAKRAGQASAQTKQGRR